MKKLFLSIIAIITLSLSPSYASAPDHDSAIVHLHETYVRQIPGELLGCLGGVAPALEKFQTVYNRHYVAIR